MIKQLSVFSLQPSADSFKLLKIDIEDWPPESPKGGQQKSFMMGNDKKRILPRSARRTRRNNYGKF